MIKIALKNFKMTSRGYFCMYIWWSTFSWGGGGGGGGLYSFIPFLPSLGANTPAIFAREIADSE